MRYRAPEEPHNVYVATSTIACFEGCRYRPIKRMFVIRRTMFRVAGVMVLPVRGTRGNRSGLPAPLPNQDCCSRRPMRATVEVLIVAWYGQTMVVTDGIPRPRNYPIRRAISLMLLYFTTIPTTDRARLSVRFCSQQSGLGENIELFN